MNKKPKLVYGIKGKLVSAACMLLVAVIMVVSSTYAWFTLSTAPEVTGIQTAVGANGSLEMALVPSNNSDIVSNVGDSNQDWSVKNVTWGNLVDLTNGYGLDQITLYPSLLNATSGVIATAPLKTPTYGADGRVDDVLANTVVGTYDSTSTSFKSNSNLGVRAVGVASGMTTRQLDFRNARSAANTAMVLAKTQAGQSLNNNGNALANVALKKATNANPTFTQADVASLQAIVTDLTKDGGVLDQIETAYMQLLLAYAASSLSGASDTGYSAVKGIIEGQGATLDSVVTELQQYVTLPENFTTAVNAFKATKTKVEEAQTALNNMADDGDDATFDWATMSVPLYNLADTDNMKINNIKAGEIKDGDNMSNLINSVAGGGVIVTMETGGGVYADVADHCGDYKANVTIEKVEYNGLTLSNMAATMKTVTTAKYLDTFSAGLEGKAPAGTAGAGDQPITEFYGYIIDLAFRTNAPDSDLLLSTAKDRIYSDNSNPETMGGGSTMTFDSGLASEFGIEKVKELLKAIRVVFFTPAADGTSTGTVVAEARLDVDGATGNTARLCLVGEDGVTLIKDEKNAVIMPLQQNATVKLSVLVYLDGTNVGNDDVAASVAQSITGALNLQFASSATLVPMDYADLHQPAQGN